MNDSKKRKASSFNMQERAEKVLEGIPLVRLKVRSQLLNSGRKSGAHFRKPFLNR
jgi:hypothetical protein